MKIGPRPFLFIFDPFSAANTSHCAHGSRANYLATVERREFRRKGGEMSETNRRKPDIVGRNPMGGTTHAKGDNGQGRGSEKCVSMNWFKDKK